MCSATAVTTATLVIVLCLVTITARGEAVSELEWFACPEHSDLSCAYFNIPLDYHDPTAGGGHLFVVKSNATARGKKGTIFLNPGQSSLLGPRWTLMNLDHRRPWRVRSASPRRLL